MIVNSWYSYQRNHTCTLTYTPMACLCSILCHTSVKVYSIPVTFWFCRLIKSNRKNQSEALSEAWSDNCFEDTFYLVVKKYWQSRNKALARYNFRNSLSLIMQHPGHLLLILIVRINNIALQRLTLNLAVPINSFRWRMMRWRMMCATRPSEERQIMLRIEQCSFVRKTYGERSRCLCFHFYFYLFYLLYLMSSANPGCYEPCF